MIITKTPLRISLLGGNTDFPEYYREHGGLCLTATIDKYIYCIVKKRFDNLIIVNYSIKEIVEKVDDIKHDLVREAMKMVGVYDGVEISFLSDIPSQGTGLGSSSAVTVGVLNALHTYIGENVSTAQLAEEACTIEILRLEKHIGVQDQYATAFGGLRQLNLLVGGEINSIKVGMDESVKEDFNNSLMLFYTGITRKADDILNQFKVISNSIILDQNKTLAHNGTLHLMSGDLKSFGYCLEAYWQLKKKLGSKVTNPEIDKMYEKAKKAGAIGGKIIGAGGGGFLLVMFPAHKRASIRNALEEYKELPFRLEDQGSKVLLNI